MAAREWQCGRSPSPSPSREWQCGRASRCPLEPAQVQFGRERGSVKERVTKLAGIVDKSMEVVGQRLGRHRTEIDKMQGTIDSMKLAMDETTEQLRIQTRQLEQARQETLALREALEALSRRCLPEGGMLALLREAERGVPTASSGLQPSQRPPKDEHKPSRKRGRVKDEPEEEDEASSGLQPSQSPPKQSKQEHKPNRKRRRVKDEPEEEDE